MRLVSRVGSHAFAGALYLAVAVCAATSIGASRALPAQNVDNVSKGEVLRVVDRFFTAMSQRDTAEAKRVLVLSGGLYAVRATGSDSAPPRRSNADFVAMLSKPGQRLQERMWNPTVQIDGAIAHVWAPYDFHLDGKFSHCGTDSFALIRTIDGWKITETVYTVQLTACAPSPLGAIK